MANRLRRDLSSSGGRRLRPTDSLRVSRKQLTAENAKMTKSKSAGVVDCVADRSSSSASDSSDRDDTEVAPEVVRRSELCRRQTFAYKRHEVDFKSRRRPQLFDLAVLVELKTPEEIVGGGGTVEPIYFGSRLIPTITFQLPSESTAVRPDLLRSLPPLCYPDFSAAEPVREDFNDELFVVTLTDETGRRTFAYCGRFLRPNGIFPEVAAIVSPVQSADFYFQLLSKAIFRLRLSRDLFDEFLAGLLPRPFPTTTAAVAALLDGLTITVDHNFAPSEQLRLSTTQDCAATLQYVGPDHLIAIVAALLAEKRILLVGDAVPLLARTVQAVTTLLYPLEWPHTLIPVVPGPFVDVCHSPTPYLIGVLRPQLHRLKELLVGGADEFLLILDLDMGIVRDVDYADSTPQSARVLPSRAVRNLRVQLDSLDLSAADVLSGKSSGRRADERLRHIFLRFFVDLLGHFDRHVAVQQDGAKIFQPQTFIEAKKSRSHRQFLRWFIQTGIFQVWRQKRLTTVDDQESFDRAVVAAEHNRPAAADAIGQLLKQLKFNLTRS